MLTVFIVDKAALARSTLVEAIGSLLGQGGAEMDLLPRIDLRSVAPEELKFHSAPDICVVGSKMLSHELTNMRLIREVLPNTPLLVELSEELKSISIVEQLARLGADDTFHKGHDAHEFVRKLIVLSKRSGTKAGGKLVLIDSGKGGMGVTSVCAAVMESLAKRDQQVVGVDFDFESQDLSRFLGAKPFVNENLELFFSRNRPITEEFVDQSLASAMVGEDLVKIMSPLPDGSYFYKGESGSSQILISIMETLDRMADYVVVDMASCVGSMLRTMYRFADQCIFVLNNDPAVLYASIDKLTKIRGYISAGAHVNIVLNNVSGDGLPIATVRDELQHAVGERNVSICGSSIPHCKTGLRWPGSGRSLASLSSPTVRSALNDIVAECFFVKEQTGQRVAAWKIVSQMAMQLAGRRKLKIDESASSSVRRSNDVVEAKDVPLLIGPPQTGDETQEQSQEDLISKYVQPAGITGGDVSNGNLNQKKENNYVEH